MLPEWVKTVSVEPVARVPILKLPLTSSVAPGVVVPTPTLPPEGFIKMFPLVAFEVDWRVNVPEAAVPP